MKNYYLSDDGTKLTLSVDPLTRINSITVGHGKQSHVLQNGRPAAYFVIPSLTGTQHGDYTITVDVTATFKGAQMQVAFEKSGVFIGNGWTPFMNIPIPGSYTFKVTDTGSGGWTSTDFLQAFIQVKNINKKNIGTVRWSTGTVSPVVAPFSSSKLVSAFTYKES